MFGDRNKLFWGLLISKAHPLVFVLYFIKKHVFKFAKHIFQYHSIGISLHQEKGCNFTVDDTFREKVANFLKNEEK